uniref:Uncharacterized protein n=1 Tax=Pyrodinium bahamense TaxID=73915 RepID=A0A7S0FGD5_9DINO|mmetsp:Transcript_29669/g.81672  ORF Transcript_29669/g.81672 Transcript_29669/m.81672 type:complete len:176 (+) Transcript_29669:64-591(+)
MAQVQKIGMRKVSEGPVDTGNLSHMEPDASNVSLSWPHMESGSDEHPGTSDELSDVHPWAQEAEPHELSTEAALDATVALAERFQRMIQQHLCWGDLSPKVAMESDQAWKEEFNEGLRRLRKASNQLSCTLAAVIPAHYCREEGNLIGLKAMHLVRILDSLHSARDSIPLFTSSL